MKDEVGLPVISDVHQVADVEPAARVLDVLQIPAFLCRQTDLLGGRGPNRQGGQYQERPVHGPLGHGPGGGQGVRHRQSPGAAHRAGRHVRLQQPGGGFPQPAHHPGSRVPRGPGRDPQRPACPGARVRAPAARGSISPCWPGPGWPRGWTPCSWRSIPTPSTPGATAPIPCPWRRSCPCGGNWRPCTSCSGGRSNRLST